MESRLCPRAEKGRGKAALPPGAAPPRGLGSQTPSARGHGASVPGHERQADLATEQGRARRPRGSPRPDGGTTRASQGTCRLWGTAHGPQRRTPPRGPAPAAARGGDGRVRRRPFRNRKQNRGPWRSAPQSLAERTGYDVISKFRPADDPLCTKRLLPACPGPPGAPAASWAGGRPGPRAEELPHRVASGTTLSRRGPAAAELPLRSGRPSVGTALAPGSPLSPRGGGGPALPSVLAFPSLPLFGRS